MNKWFDELRNNYAGRNRFYTTSYYNPSTGEVYLHSFLGLVSIGLAVFGLLNYMSKQEMLLAVILAVPALGAGIAGLILSFRNFPYAFRCKSIYMISTIVSGIIFSLLGIIMCLVLGFLIFVPGLMIVS